MSSISPPKGSPADREMWKNWAQRNGLLNRNASKFIPQIISERRRVFRTGLDPKDTALLGRIERGLINLFHFINGTTERWPETIRTMLTKIDRVDEQNLPFESWVGPPGLENRMQAIRVWTDLLQFLVLEYHVNNISWSDNHTMSIMVGGGYLSQMLKLSDERGDDIEDIIQADMMYTMTGELECIRDPIHEYLLQVLMQENPTPRNNPLLFSLLLQTEEFADRDQPRLEFSGLKDTLIMREKLGALVHYAHILILDHPYKSWVEKPVPKEWKLALEKALNTANVGWADKGAPRPADQESDPAGFGDPHWVDFVAYFDGLCRKWLWKGSNSPMGVILQLL